tara:strand:+ start:337 stop:552 length:216 start_codon:yes stop_codon:yes gene_type:complete
MTGVVAKTVMKAIRANNVARIKALAQASRMSPGRLMSEAKKYSMKKKSKPGRAPKTKSGQARAIARRAGKR